jgi:hypothetical protein
MEVDRDLPGLGQLSPAEQCDPGTQPAVGGGEADGVKVEAARIIVEPAGLCDEGGAAGGSSACRWEMGSQTRRRISLRLRRRRRPLWELKREKAEASMGRKLRERRGEEAVRGTK